MTTKISLSSLQKAFSPSSSLAFLVVEEKSHLVEHNENFSNFFDQAKFKSILCLRPYLDPEDFEIFFYELKTCFERREGLYTSIRVKTQLNKVKWLNVILNHREDFGGTRVECVFRDATSENIQTRMNERCLELWADYSKHGDLENLREGFTGWLKELFAAQDAFSFKFNRLSKTLGDFQGKKSARESAHVLMGRAGSFYQKHVCDTGERLDFLSFDLNERQIQVIGLVNMWPNLEKDFEVCAKLAQNVFGNIARLAALNEKNLQAAQRMEIVEEAANIGVWDWNLTSGVFQFDDTCFSLLGYERGDLPTDLELVHELVHPADIGTLSRAYQAHIRGNTAQAEVKFRIKRKDGSYVSALSKAKIQTRINPWDPLIISGVYCDISHIESLQEEIKQKEALIYHQDKLATLGELSASITHEIKTPLTIIAAASELLKQKYKNDEAAQRPLRMQSDGIARIVKVVDGLRSQVREDGLGVRECFLGDIARDCINFLSILFAKSDIKIDYVCSNPLLRVKCDPMKIQQTLVNLMNNAKDAIGANEVGRLVVVECHGNEEFAFISVKDFGRGVPLADAERIFQSFFSTKTQESGTGLGLFISKKIMLEHQGDLILENPGYVGARFTMSLPLAK